MKTNITLLALFLLFITGCKNTTPEQASYRTIGTIAHTVDVTMKSWGDYVATGQASASDEVQVKGAYTKYQAAMHAAKSVVASVGSQPEGESAISVAMSALSDASGDLVAMINEFIPKKEPTP